MLKRLFHLFVGKRYHRLVLLVGLFLAAWALKGLAQHAVYVHESVCVPAVVVDVRQHPFDSTWEALRGGNRATAGDTAYQPIVRFALPGNGVPVTRLLPDADTENYQEGEQVEVRTMPLDPSTARLNNARLIWAADAELLLLGGGLVLLGRLLRGRRRKAEPKKPPVSQAPARKGEQQELPLGLEPAPAKPKRNRKSVPRKPRKKKES